MPRAFQIRNKPVAPDRDAVEKFYYTISDLDLVPLKGLEQKLYNDFVDYCERTGYEAPSIDDVVINEDFYYENHEIQLVAECRIGQKRYDEQYAYYKKRLKEYNIWYNKNKDKIEEELQRREKKALQQNTKRLKAIEKEKKRLEKEAEQIKKELGNE